MIVRCFLMWLAIFVVVTADCFQFAVAVPHMREANPIVAWLTNTWGREAVIVLKMLAVGALAIGLILESHGMKWVEAVLACVFAFYMAIAIWLAFSWGVYCAGGTP